MDRRQTSVVLLAVSLVLLGVFSWAGDRRVFWVYVGLLVPVLVFHWAYACRRCPNTACALNSASESFFFERRRTVTSGEEPDPVNSLVGGVPLVLTVGVGIYGAWLADPLLALGAVALTAAGFVLYAGVTCRYCPNDCPNAGRRNKTKRSPQ